MSKEITCEILKDIGVLSTNSRGYTKELNIISWNNGEPKYDIREWYPGHELCGKGITFTDEEIHNLFMYLSALFEGTE